MKKILILGAGTAGTISANILSKKLKSVEVQITIVDKSPDHYYQPGFLFIPFGIYSQEQVKKNKKDFINKKVNFILGEVDQIEPKENTVKLLDGQTLDYDYLIISTGCKIAPEETDGMLDGWRKSIFDFYTFEGSCALASALKEFKGGNLVIHINEMPIKCPVAPLEFAFLTDWYFVRKKIRNKIKITYLTPLSGAFTKPLATQKLSELLKKKNIQCETEFVTERIDVENKKIISYDGREINYDLMVTIPTNMGEECITKSSLGDDLNFVPTEKHTLRAKDYNNIFVIGDATNLPSSKAGAVAHFESEVLLENIIRTMTGEELKQGFDGHANCFIETGFGKAILIDFNYDYEPLPGKFPFRFIGPASLLKETIINHWGKLAFRWIYWNLILKAVKIPFINSKMGLHGKIIK